MWEQTVALGIPCIFRDIEGFHHVDLDGNAVFVKEASEQELNRVIQDLLDNPEKYYDRIKSVDAGYKKSENDEKLYALMKNLAL